MKRIHCSLAVVAVGALASGMAWAADYHHVHITASSPSEAVSWYTEHMDCQPAADRRDAADCGGVELVFVVQPTMGSTQGTGVNHIGFSYANLEAKMADLEAVGVRGSGVRLQRFEDGSTLRDIPGLFKIGFIFDPWGHAHRARRGPRHPRVPSRAPELDRSRGHPRLVSRHDGRRGSQSQGADGRPTVR